MAKALHTARKIQYRYQALEAKRKERENEAEPELSQVEVKVEPTEEELEEIDPPARARLDKLQGTEDYSYKIERAEELIEEEKQKALRGSRDDYASAMEKYVRAKEAFKAKIDQIDEIEKTATQMKEDMQLRKSRWRQFRDYISDYSGDKFDETREFFAGSSVAHVFFSSLTLLSPSIL